MTGQKKIAFLAKLLPIVGLVFFLPPLVSIADINTQIFGFPAIIAYLFAVWLLVIIAAYFLQKKLPSHVPEQSEENRLDPLKKSNGKKP